MLASGPSDSPQERDAGRDQIRDQIVLPAGTHLPLQLRNGVNTGTAKTGDVVYFETTHPISLGNRVVIPVGSFVRGVILTAKRPGRIRLHSSR